jgi:hypothetical protein
MPLSKQRIMPYAGLWYSKFSSMGNLHWEKTTLVMSVLTDKKKKKQGCLGNGWFSKLVHTFLGMLGFE